jgi:hypothetical protein
MAVAELIATPSEVAVRVRCPSCGETGTLPLTLASRVTMTEGENSKLSIRAKAPSLPHLCGQLTIAEALRELEGGDRDSDRGLD